jgi:hypothetical protein
MPAMKSEMLPNQPRIAEMRAAMTAMGRAVCDLAFACGDCDGSYDSVEAVRDAADAVSSAGADCHCHATSVAEGARRSCDRLT